MELTTIILVALATARITRLITTDRITDSSRARIARKLGTDHALTYLAFCPWCVSVYVGAALSVTGWQWARHDWFIITTVALSASYVTGFLASHTED